MDNLKSENEVAFLRTQAHENTIIHDLINNEAPCQLREEFKEKIERQNFNIKQPEASGGDVFIEGNRRSESTGWLGKTVEVEVNGTFKTTLSQ